MSILTRIFGEKRSREPMLPLYRAIIDVARDSFWYREGQVPDTVDGRFAMISAILALVLLRLEAEGEAFSNETVLLTELFIDDMEGNVRQLGIGDLVVGKHVGRMVSALGGRLGAFRDKDSLEMVIQRNIFHDAPPSKEAVRLVTERLTEFRRAMSALPPEQLIAGELPRP